MAGTALLAMLLGAAAPANATPPGKNGKIAFVDGGDIWSMNPDGTAKTQLTSGSELDAAPDWSPDGTRIAFGRSVPGPGSGIYVMNADGSDEHLIVAGGTAPSWSPDGARLAYVAVTAGHPRIWTANSDGTNATDLPMDGEVYEEEFGPKWSTDGEEIAFIAHACDDCVGYSWEYFVATVRVDGTGNSTADFGWPFDWSPDSAYLLVSYFGDEMFNWRRDGGTGSSQYEFIRMGPADASWSADGHRIVVDDTSGASKPIVVIDAHGGNPTTIGTGTAPDWQSLPINGYPRPRAANLQEIPLVPSYAVCTSPNRTHGPPLAYGSCNPPAKVSDEATIGTPDANGKPVKGEGKARYATLPGDVRIDLEIADVYDHATLDDYAGELRLHSLLRITDKRNAPHPGGPGAGTVTDTILGATATCTPTADPNQGATCLVNTTANALAPGTASAGARSIWRLGQVRVDDGGADGDADTAGDNTQFMVQGLFVP